MVQDKMDGISGSGGRKSAVQEVVGSYELIRMRSSEIGLVGVTWLLDRGWCKSRILVRDDEIG